MPPHLFFSFRASCSHNFPDSNSCMSSQTKRYCCRTKWDFVLLTRGRKFHGGPCTHILINSLSNSLCFLAWPKSSQNQWKCIDWIKTGYINCFSTQRFVLNFISVLILVTISEETVKKKDFFLCNSSYIGQNYVLLHLKLFPILLVTDAGLLKGWKMRISKAKQTSSYSIHSYC